MNDNQKIFTEELEKMKESRVISQNDYNHLIFRYRTYLNQVATTPANFQPTAPIASNVRPAAPKKEFNLSLLFTIGICLIILSSIILIISSWTRMTDFTKLFSIIIFDLSFFAAAYLTRKSLKLPKTAYAFWNLGVLCLPVIIIAIGYFGLINEYLSFEGPGVNIYLGLSFMAIIPLLAFSMIHYKSPLYLVMSVLNIMWIVLCFSNHFDFPFKAVLVIWSLMLSGLIALGKHLPWEGLNQTHRIFSEILLYALPVLNLFAFDRNIWGIIVFAVAIGNLYLLLRNTHYKRYWIFLSPLLYALLLSFHYNLSFRYDFNIHNLVVTTLMLVMALWLTRYPHLKYFNLATVLLAHTLLYFNIKAEYYSSFEIVSVLSLYEMTAITAAYILLGKSKSLVNLAKLWLPVVGLLANLDVYLFIRSFGYAGFLSVYDFFDHFLISVLVLAFPFLFIKVRDDVVFSIYHAFFQALLIFAVFVLPTFRIEYSPSFLFHSSLYLFTFAVVLALFFRLKREFRHAFLFRLFNLIILFITLNNFTTFLLASFSVDGRFISFVNLTLCAGSVAASFLKTRYQKPWAYAGIGILIYATILMLAMQSYHMGTVLVLLAFTLLVVLTCGIMNSLGHKLVPYICFIPLYVVPFLDFSFFYNQYLYLVIMTVISYLLSLSQVLKSRNNYLTYLSYGLIAFLILRSTNYRNLYPIMIAITAFLPLALMLLVYNETNAWIKRVGKVLMIMTILVPYWFALTQFGFIDPYRYEFILIPVIICGTVSSFMFLSDLSNWSLILIPFVGLPLFILMVNYAATGDIVHGLVLVILSILIIFGGFFKRNLTLFLNGTGGLLLSLFIIIFYIYKESPWWLYLLVLGLLIVFIAGYNEYVKNKKEA